MRFVLARWSMNGTFLGTSPLTTQLSYCGGQPASSKPGWLKYGASTQQTTTCDLSALLAQARRHAAAPAAAHGRGRGGA
jgi:hypothetical protein